MIRSRDAKKKKKPKRSTLSDDGLFLVLFTGTVSPFGLVEPIVISVPALIGQENVKTKHPQLHYESKLYMLLQGGSKLMP